MPAEASIKSPEKHPWHPAEIPDYLVLILDILRNAVREDVIHHYVRNPKTVVFQQTPAVRSGIAVGDGTSRLRLRVFGDKLAQLPDPALSIAEQDPKNFPRPAVVHHHPAARLQPG